MHDTVPHQFHQIFSLAYLLGDGQKLVVAHEKDFKGEVEQVFWQDWQQISTVEKDQTLP